MTIETRLASGAPMHGRTLLAKHHRDRTRTNMLKCHARERGEPTKAPMDA